MRTLNYKVELAKGTPYFVAGIPAFEEDLAMKLDFDIYPSIQMEVQTYGDKKLSDVFVPLKSLEDTEDASFSEDLAQNLEDVLSGKSEKWRLIGAGIDLDSLMLHYAHKENPKISDSVLLHGDATGCIHQVSFRYKSDIIDVLFTSVLNRVQCICEHDDNSDRQRFIKFDSVGKHMLIQEFY